MAQLIKCLAHSHENISLLGTHIKTKHGVILVMTMWGGDVEGEMSRFLEILESQFSKFMECQVSLRDSATCNE